MAKDEKVKHIGCCINNTNYKPDKIRSKPFKWIHFPIFIAIWLVLFWFVICPITWSKAANYYSNQNPKLWPKNWMFCFWVVALLIFTIILVFLLMLWKCCAPKEVNYYDQVFLNPEQGDEKENLCIHCMSFHAPGGGKCPCNTKSDTDICGNCGNKKESFGICCQKGKKLDESILPGPKYDVTVRKQQPDVVNIDEDKIKDNVIKRNSLRIPTKNRNSSGSNIVISAHEVDSKDHGRNKLDDHEIIGIKIIKDDNIQYQNKSPVDVPSKFKVKTKKFNLPPVDVELANRASNVEFFGEKIPLGAKTMVVNEKTSVVTKRSIENNEEPKTVSVSSMDSMNKEKFNRFLHLVEINTPITPKEFNVDDEIPLRSPMSPREIFFRDLFIAAENSESGNGHDSPYFGTGKLEKKRPTSHILIASDKYQEEITSISNSPKEKVSKRHTLANVKIPSPNKLSPKSNEDLESPRILALTKSISFNGSENDDQEEKVIIRDDTHGATKKTTVKIIRSSVSSPRVLTPSEKKVMQDFMSCKKEDIKNLKYVTPDQSSSAEDVDTDVAGKSCKCKTNGKEKKDTQDDDEVFTK